MTTLVLAQNNHGKSSDTNSRLISAALQLGSEVHVVVVENAEGTLAREIAKLKGVEQVYQIPAPGSNALACDEPAASLRPLMERAHALIASNGAPERDILLRLAAWMKIPALTGISALPEPQVFERPVYAGSLVERVRIDAAKYFLTIRTANFDPVASQPACSISLLEPPGSDQRIEILEVIETGNERPDLATASLVIAGGRGVGSKENFGKLEAFADQMGAAIGASRIAVDMGWAPHHLQVGQTGVHITPELYIALGISGAVQHIAGIKDAGKIIAVNKDREAPIFQVANYGLVGDLHALLPALQKALTHKGL